MFIAIGNSSQFSVFISCLKQEIGEIWSPKLTFMSSLERQDVYKADIELLDHVVNSQSQTRDLINATWAPQGHDYMPLLFP